MGLPISVYRDAGCDCTANGISKRFQNFTVINVEGPFDPSPDRPAVLLEQHVKGCVRIVEAGPDGKRLNRNDAAGPMFGGNYAATSDSRFGDAIAKLIGQRFYGAVAIHDRYER